MSFKAVAKLNIQRLVRKFVITVKKNIDTQPPKGVSMNEIANLIDRKQAARMLGVTVATIDQIVKLELLQSNKIGSHRVFPWQFIQDFIEYLEEATSDKHEFKRKGFAG